VIHTTKNSHHTLVWSKK